PAGGGGPLGTWYMYANRCPLTVTIQDAGGGKYKGTLVDMDGVQEKIDPISWDPAARRLEFRRNSKSWWQWYRGTVVAGVFAGRFAQVSSAAKPGKLNAYSYHVTGWNSTHLDRGITPRVFNVLLNNQYRAWLRIDSGRGSKKFIGRLKVYATTKRGADG